MSIRSLLILTLLAAPAAAATRYVKTSGGGSGTCNSWSNACTLSYALSVASSGDELWVKAGTYGTLALVNGVKVIGGFAGTESAASQSNPKQNVTILDGGSSQRVATSNGNGASTVLRGFTIKNGADTSYDGGGGLLLQDSSALIVQCIFVDNTATWWGGAVAIRGAGSPEFINCEFRSNGSSTIIAGGAVFVYSGSPKFTNCLFVENEAGDGGAAAIQGGTPKFINCTLTDNNAYQHNGGAVHDQEGFAEVHNSIGWANTAAESGAQAYNDPSRRSKVSYSDVQGGYIGTGNLNSDPDFVDAPNGDYKITFESPCKNAGNNNLLPNDVADLDWDGNVNETIPFDLDLAPRKRSFIVDMGAYEAPLSSGSS